MKQSEMLEQMEVKQAIDHIAYYMDFNQLEKALEYFSEDARYSMTRRGEKVVDLRGKPAIRENLQNLEESSGFLFHLLGTKIVEVNELSQTASSNSCCIVRQAAKDDLNKQETQYVEYRDSWLKFNGFWYLVERCVSILAQSNEGQE